MEACNMAEEEIAIDPDPEEFTDSSPNPDKDAEWAVLGDALVELGVTRIVFRYDGSGDSGSVEEVEFEPAEARGPERLEGALQSLAEDYTPEGYENNEGGHGSLTVYPELGLAELEHFDRYGGSVGMEGVGAAELPEGLRQRLLRLGVGTVTAHADGSGDSGMMEELVTEPGDIVLGRELEEELEGFLLDRLPAGWENNQGGYADFIVDVPSGSVHVDGYWYTEEDSDASLARWKWRE
jgi:hypothetical protein